MRGKTTLLLAVLLIGLGTFFYVYDIRQGPTREQALAQKDRLWKGVETADIDEIVTTRGADTVHLKKSGGTWALVAPVASRAEARPVEDLVSSLASARSERELEAAPGKLADFGLEPPAVEVAFKAKGQERALKLGAKSPTGTWIYAQERGKPAVFLTSESLLRDAQKSASDFRDRTLLAFEKKDVKGLEIEGPAGRGVALSSKGPDAWQLTKPLTAPGDAREIGSLLDKLKAAKVKEFVTETPTSAAEYGLDRPLRVTLWVGEEKERAAKALRLGRAVAEKKGVYAQREGEPSVLLVDDELLKAIPSSPAALRDKTVFAYSREKLERVELESPKGKMALALEGGAWRITAPEALKVDESAMGQLLGQARDLRAKEFVADEVKSLAAFGLDRPQVRLSVWEKDATEPRTLLLAPAKGAKGPTEKDGAYATVRGGAGPSAPVVLVDAKALADLSRSAQELRDHSLFAAFDVRDVARVELQRGAQTLTLERKGQEEWQLLTPKKGKARAARIDDVIWTLRNLKWRDLVAQDGWAPGQYGLEPPATTITLTGKDGKPIAQLAIGKPDAGGTFVRVPGQPALYTIDPKSLGELPAAPEDLLL